jgi:hypothetical protein
VNLDGMLGSALSRAIIAQLRDDPDSPSAADLDADFESLRHLVVSDGVVLLCVRPGSQGDGFDTLTLAIPGSRGGGEAVADTTDQAPPRNEDISDLVELAHGAAVVHRSRSRANDHRRDAARSYVQLVTFVPGTQHGAVLTLLSTAPDAQAELAEEAEAIAASFSLASPPVE